MRHALPSISFMSMGLMCTPGKRWRRQPAVIPPPPIRQALKKTGVDTPCVCQEADYQRHYSEKLTALTSRGPQLNHHYGLLLPYGTKRNRSQPQARNVHHVVQRDHHNLNSGKN